MKRLITAALIALTLGCAHTSGSRFNMDDVDAMKPGVTTLTEAKEKLGKPYAVKFDAAGNQMVTWAWASTSLAGASKGAASIIFDKEGKMVRINGKSY